jgi:hypothetical protein
VIELGLLLAILVAIYTLECVCWIPAGAQAFRARTGPWTCAPEILALAGNRWRAVLGDGVPGPVGIAICEASAPPISPMGLCACNPGDEESGGRRPAIRYEDVGAAEAVGAVVRSGSRVIARAGSHAYARHLAGLIRNLREANDQGRAAIIEGEMDQMLDARAARRVLRRYRICSRELGSVSRLLAFALFVAFPAFWVAGGPRGALLTLVPIVSLTAWSASLYFALHRRLQPELGGTRNDRLFTMILAPPAAIRAADTLVRELFARFHALPLVRVAFDDAGGRDWAGRTYRRLHFELESERHACCDAGQWIRARWSARAREWITREYGHPEALLAPPERESQRSLSFCPRCHQQYLREGGTCLDCPGIPLRSFP